MYFFMDKLYIWNYLNLTDTRKLYRSKYLFLNLKKRPIDDFVGFWWIVTRATMSDSKIYGGVKFSVVSRNPFTN